MDKRTIENIRGLRLQNYSYACIGRKLGIPPNTVKSYCRRHNILPIAPIRKTKSEKSALKVCKYCGKEIINRGGQKKSFCSTACKNAYWNNVHRK